MSAPRRAEVSAAMAGGESRRRELSCNYNVKLTNLLCEERWEVKRREMRDVTKPEMQIGFLNFEFQ